MLLCGILAVVCIKYLPVKVMPFLAGLVLAYVFYWIATPLVMKKNLKVGSK